MNRIDEFADAFIGWMDEWQQKRTVGGTQQKGVAHAGGMGVVANQKPPTNTMTAGEHSPSPVSISDLSADDNLTEQAWEDYEAAIRMSPHPDCCACEDCNLKHRYEEEA